MIQSFVIFRGKVKEKFFWLLLTLIGLTFLPSFVTITSIKDFLIYFCLCLVLIIGILVLSESVKNLYRSSFLAILILLLNTFSLPIEPEFLFLIRMLSLVLFFGWLFLFVFREMVYSNSISENLIYGAIDGYLLLGILGGFGFRIVHYFYPKSFSMPMLLEEKLDVFTYFSFVTLTNLGYGDITPLTPPSQAMALFLAISGQMYLAIVIGILVGKYLLVKKM